jgi:hypothetical protein
MDCEVIEPELVAYHFGVLEGPARTAVEGHLLACHACLAAFFALKRALDGAADAGPRPSEEARARLRQAAAVELDRLAAADRRAPSRRWWRPARLALAAAGAAALVVLALHPWAERPPDAGTLHDAARPSASSGSIL